MEIGSCFVHTHIYTLFTGKGAFLAYLQGFERIIFYIYYVVS